MYQLYGVATAIDTFKLFRIVALLRIIFMFMLAKIKILHEIELGFKAENCDLIIESVSVYQFLMACVRFFASTEHN